MNYDSAVPASVTEIYFDYVDRKSTDISTLLGELKNGDYLYIYEADDVTNFNVFLISGRTDHTTYYTVSVTLTESTFAFQEDDIVVVGVGISGLMPYANAYAPASP